MRNRPFPAVNYDDRPTSAQDRHLDGTSRTETEQLYAASDNDSLHAQDGPHPIINRAGGVSLGILDRHNMYSDREMETDRIAIGNWKLDHQKAFVSRFWLDLTHHTSVW